MDSIKVLSSDKCCGCASCMNICPVGAISMQENQEGFLYPRIDDSKCTHCGLCAKSCPAIKSKYENAKKPACYAAMASDELRYDSSSGAIFPLLAYHILTLGGYVAGAVWEKDGRVKHIVSNDRNDIEKMRGSKYLQSEIQFCFKEIKTLLNKKLIVLFTGTPCQVAGLKAFLKKDYSNLYTVDLACHGTPSPKVFQKYLEQEIKDGASFVNTNFRDKINGWTPSLTTTTTTTTTTFSRQAKDDDFMNAFLKNLCLRESCGKCAFNKLPRQADITIADFWGIDRFNKELNDQKGTSVILVNNPKGQELLKNINKELKLLKKVPLKYALKGNPVFVKPCKHHKNRCDFFKDINVLNLKDAVKKNLSEKYDGVILNFWYSANNYGAVLTAYCLQEYLKEFGKDYKLVNWKPELWKKRFNGSFCEKFSKEHLSLTKEFENKAQLKELNAYTDNFIVGSDQVFRWQYTKEDLDVYLLKFTDYSKKRIAFSASFGKDTYEGDQLTTYETKKALKRFDAISTREISGVDLCKNTFGINVEHIIDPVFLVKKESIERLVDKDMNKYRGKIVTYVLDNREVVKTNIDLLATNQTKEIVSIEGKNISLEEWLSAIYNCDYFVTDSFHGACIAMIFHKPFVCLKNIARGVARFESLQKTFNINDNFIYDANLLSNSKFASICIDWEILDTIILNERNKAKEWLENVLNASKTQEHFSAELDFVQSKNQVETKQQENVEKKEKFIEKIFSIRNALSKSKKYKVVKILGIKVKIRKGK